MSTEIIRINKPLLDYEEVRAAIVVLRSGILTEKNGRGPNVLKFEQAFSHYINTKYAIAFNSGTSALHASLVALGIGKGDEVIVPSFTFVATAEAVVLCGAKPIFVDIDPETYCIDTEEVESEITSKTKAIIPVHLYGLSADMKPLMEISDKKGIFVIEDAAQALGAKYFGQNIGKIGHLSCFSFYGSKIITTGEGGMVTTENEEYAENLISIRSHGEIRPYKSIMIGHNYRMPELEAAIGLSQLQKIKRFLEIRKNNADYFFEMLNGTTNIQLPIVPEGYEHAWYVFTIRLKGANAAKRNKVLNRIREKYIDAQVYYPTPVHLMPYYHNFHSGILQKTETISRQVISLPVNPSISDAGLIRIVDAVKKALI